MILLIVATEILQVLGRERYQPPSIKHMEAQLSRPGDSLVVGIVVARKKIVF